MKLIDANILLNAYDERSPLHRPAKAWLEQTISANEPVALAHVTLLAFLRIATNARVFKAPLDLKDAFEIVETLLEHPNVVVLVPAEQHFVDLADVAIRAQAAGPLLMDAHLAQLAREHGATLCTTDRDFARFDGLTWENPLEADAP